MDKPGRNDPCPCGSGKKFKRCHGSSVPAPLPFGNGNLRLQDVFLEASEEEATDHGYAQAFLQIAARLVDHSHHPTAGLDEALQAVVSLALAAEALANRLLEPIVPKDSWPDLEQKPPLKKWGRLYSDLKIRPGYSPTKEPTKSLSDLFNLRNDLLHFKHGKNLTITERPLWTVRKGVRTKIDPSKTDPPKIVSSDTLRRRLGPGEPLRFYGALRAALAAVLDCHPSDEFQIVTSLRRILTILPTAEAIGAAWGTDEVRAECRALWSALIDAQAYAERAFAGATGAVTPQERVARILMLRLAARLRAIDSVALTRSAYELGVLASSVVEMAVLSAWMGSDPNRALQLEEFGLSQNAEWGAVRSELFGAGLTNIAEQSIKDARARVADALGSSHGLPLPTIKEMAVELPPGRFNPWSSIYLNTAPHSDRRGGVCQLEIGDPIDQIQLGFFASAQGTACMLEHLARLLPPIAEGKAIIARLHQALDSFSKPSDELV